MALKIIYFIAGHVPTAGEAADIAKLEAGMVVGAPYSLSIRSNLAISEYGDERFETCDFVAGTLPSDSAANTFYGAIDTIDPDAVPGVITDSATQVIVTDGDTLDDAGGGTIAVAVADGVATYTYTAS